MPLKQVFSLIVMTSGRLCLAGEISDELMAECGEFSPDTISVSCKAVLGIPCPVLSTTPAPTDLSSTTTPEPSNSLLLPWNCTDLALARPIRVIQCGNSGSKPLCPDASIAAGFGFYVLDVYSGAYAGLFTIRAASAGGVLSRVREGGVL